ncbi:hypothetical protein PpBr36_07349 [Pyricularia pennisetigena]|uniref:hypothetical protein n=1 Tax=Pyricularia pennisetigena TaxID=1578925 RepID=UPI001151C997|nr:hypothetical protein PpBr36_07349 [Pyricularia pennisetigena]TLS25657.1 hypothetical protein PpBr36_07349 [Pyricularia pennisetigena]
MGHDRPDYLAPTVVSTDPLPNYLQPQAALPGTACPGEARPANLSSWNYDLDKNDQEISRHSITIFRDDRTTFDAPKNTDKMAFVNAPNKVPYYQRFYQTAYRNHQRVWKIVSLYSEGNPRDSVARQLDSRSHSNVIQHPRSKYMLVPYLVGLWGGLGLSLWGLGRKAAGYNSYWGEK